MSGSHERSKLHPGDTPISTVATQDACSTHESHIKTIILENVLVSPRRCGDLEYSFLKSVNPVRAAGWPCPSIWAWPPPLAGVQDDKTFDDRCFGFFNCYTGDNQRTTYWWVRRPDDVPVGMIRYFWDMDYGDLRNRGNLLISIAEPYRNQGYGTAALKAVKEKYSEEDLLCVVDEDNMPMRHIIESCGGKLWNIVEVERDIYAEEGGIYRLPNPRRVYRYWL